jgi:hypothetical protein
VSGAAGVDRAPGRGRLRTGRHDARPCRWQPNGLVGTSSGCRERSLELDLQETGGLARRAYLRGFLCRVLAERGSNIAITALMGKKTGSRRRSPSIIDASNRHASPESPDAAYETKNWVSVADLRSDGSSAVRSELQVPDRPPIITRIPFRQVSRHHARGSVDRGGADARRQAAAITGVDESTWPTGLTVPR